MTLPRAPRMHPSCRATSELYRAEHAPRSQSVSCPFSSWARRIPSRSTRATDVRIDKGMRKPGGLRLVTPDLDADRAFAEVALRDLHVHARRLLRGEGGIQCGAELFDTLDPESDASARL